MIQLLFFLRFRTQLRRTRPELIIQLEESIIRTIEAAGGRVNNKHRIITGTFDEDSLGIWLNIITVLDAIQAFLDKAASELYGYSLVIGRDILDYEMSSLCSTLASRPGGTGIWCAPLVLSHLSPYTRIEEKIPETEPEPHTEAAEQEAAAYSGEYFLIKGYARLKIIETLSREEVADKGANLFPFRENILEMIKSGISKNAILLGPAFMGKRDGLYRFCDETLGEIPPLILRFGPRKSLGYFADVLTPKIRAFISGSVRSEKLEELDKLMVLIFRERLMDEYSEHLIQKVRLFLRQVLSAYNTMVRRSSSTPIFIMENIQLADDTAVRIFLEVFNELPDKTFMQVYGTCSYQTGFLGIGIHGTSSDELSFIEERLKAWKGVFPRVIRFSYEDYHSMTTPEMSRDLWEIAYTLELLGRYFPGALLPQLFEEEEKKSAVILRAFALFSDLGVIDSTEDPLPRIFNFTAHAIAILGERKERIHQFVRNRLLAWVFSGKLRPCFSLLEILAELEGSGGDRLILESIYWDVINGTYQRIEQAITENRFNEVVGVEKCPALYYIFITLKALIHGNEQELREAFKQPMPEGNFFSGYKIQMFANLVAYYLGIKNLESATDIIKEAMLVGQRQKQGIAQLYRLFSLISLSRQQIDDSIDYISFAVDNAEKSEQFDELGLSAYYAASAQFLYGNLSKAEQLAQKAEQIATAFGRFGWADRARFLQGKLRFEIGYYQDAIEIFTALKDKPTDALSADMEQVLTAWIYRAKVYAGNRAVKKPGSLHGDAFLFEVEASYMTKDYQRTIALTETIPTPFPEADFLHIERPDWRSGFTQCELLLLPPKDFWERMSFAYRALALCRISASGNEREQVIQRMQRFTRDELLPDTDPNDIFYFYAYYRVLQESNGSEIDLNTAVSMAFKRLQRRASRIDDLETRRIFLNLHYWNSILSNAAKEHKLI